MRRVAVFCGSRTGTDPAFVACGTALGRELAGRGLGLVYGGGRVGLMGVVADAVLEAGGTVTGVIPEFMSQRELAHLGATEMRVVGSMHERKRVMSELADAFIALPGGLGTLDELVEILTWAQLRFHAKPCGLLNVAGYFDLLLAFFDHAVAQGLIRPEHRALLAVEEAPARLLERFAQPPR